MSFSASAIALAPRILRAGSPSAGPNWATRNCSQDGDSGFRNGPDIILYLGALVSENISRVCEQIGQVKPSVSRGAALNSVRS
jgi:hypothetical protein